MQTQQPSPTNPTNDPSKDPAKGLPEGENVHKNIATRRMVGKVWTGVFLSSLIIAIFVLLVLLYTVLDETMGYIAIENRGMDPATLAERPLEDLPDEALITILRENIRGGIFNTLEAEKPFTERSHADLLNIIREQVLKQRVIESWSLTASLFNKKQIEKTMAEEHPEAILKFQTWLTPSFLTTHMSSAPLFSGVRAALLGSLWMIGITILVAFPIGVGAAIYLEEYARDNWLNRIIQTNINNLAGVPSIIYGMLGLAIFVRVMEHFTSGVFLGSGSENGRTIISAGLTMALLILPIIIINAQEAVRAVPNSLRQASYGLGATQWQTIWNHVLPGALPGIFTGTILAVSRAIGETAPLIVVGASTLILQDPEGPFSKFTVLPILIYNWTARPQDDFRNIAAAAIIVLLILLLTLNATAILLRNRFRRSM